MIGFNNSGVSPQTQVGFFKGNNTQQVNLGTSTKNSGAAGANSRKSQSTGRQGMNRLVPNNCVVA